MNNIASTPVRMTLGDRSILVPMFPKVLAYTIVLGGVTPTGREMKVKSVTGSVRVHTLIMEHGAMYLPNYGNMSEEDMYEYLFNTCGYWGIHGFLDKVCQGVALRLKDEAYSAFKARNRLKILNILVNSGNYDTMMISKAVTIALNRLISVYDC